MELRQLHSEHALATHQALLRDVQLKISQMRKIMDSFNIDVDGTGIDTRGRARGNRRLNLLREYPTNPQNT
jgi:hypothetical protein